MAKVSGGVQIETSIKHDLSYLFQSVVRDQSTNVGTLVIALMCYVLLLSTTSEADLAACNSEWVQFTQNLPEIADTAKLKYPNRWYIGSKLGCSCTFRHLYSIDLGFGRPVDWYDEDPDDIQATLQLIALIRRLMEGGEMVDCVDVWDHKNMHPAAEAVLTVDLSKVTDEEFRFFENHHFIFENAI